MFDPNIPSNNTGRVPQDLPPAAEQQHTTLQSGLQILKVLETQFPGIAVPQLELAAEEIPAQDESGFDAGDELAA